MSCSKEYDGIKDNNEIRYQINKYAKDSQIKTIRLVPEFNDTLPRDKRPYCDRATGWDVKSE